MSFEEFMEFRRKLSKYMLKLEHSRSQCSLVNSNHSSRTSNENQTEVCGYWKTGHFHAGDMLSSEQCCIAVKKGSSWQRCNRKCSMKVLTINLEKIAIAKKLDLGVADEDPHMGICLFHWKLIKYGKFDLTKNEDVKLRQSGESQCNEIERDNEMKFNVAAENLSSSGDEDSIDGVDSMEEEAASSSQDVETKRTRTAVDESDDEDEQQDSEDDEESFITFQFAFVICTTQCCYSSLARVSFKI